MREAHSVYKGKNPKHESLPTLTVAYPKDDLSCSEDNLTGCGGMLNYLSVKHNQFSRDGVYLKYIK